MVSFADYPTARSWYRAHNSSVVAAYLDHRDLAEAESTAERFFMNVVLCRVLYTHALVAAPRISLGWLRPLAPFRGDNVSDYLTDELGFGRLLDYGMIVPRLQQLYECSAHELSEPGLLDCIRGGSLIYAWPFEERDVWHPRKSVLLRLAHRMLPAERQTHGNGTLPS